MAVMEARAEMVEMFLYLSTLQQMAFKKGLPFIIPEAPEANVEMVGKPAKQDRH